ncbi:hypothetical protein BDF20DRAFT_815436 [Mycotypha africana]|uniref:uncharacterized protein n=1 Tax=Mycotypha africana TaxID=64632 RepID=UPI002301FE4B|nr:uncharacterized protein BDF20DRAFT_815436 [Mycotypha africana]KAI8987744.1 hypothetical protein BDF20DRAFT_815436 [Mycotypha africana]
MLVAEINQKKRMIQQLDEEIFYYRHVNSELTERVNGTQERMLMRQKDQRQLLDNYNEHVRSRRATNDDVASIHKKLLELKYNIKQLSAALVRNNDYDPMLTTQAISKFWVNLHDAIKRLGEPLPPHRIQMLIEKFLMDVLVQNMNYNAFTGLKISQPYTQLQMWFERYDPSFCTRLRQEIAKVVVLHDVPGSDVAQEIQKLNKRMYTSLYTSLLKAFPSIEKNDQQLQQQQQQKLDMNENKQQQHQYSIMLRSMVEQASHIGYAMRGQEVEIAAAAVGEGTEIFDSKTMIDEDGQTSGIIQFCICPPFILYANRVELLEKARVLCFTPVSSK